MDALEHGQFGLRQDVRHLTKELQAMRTRMQTLAGTTAINTTRLNRLTDTGDSGAMLFSGHRAVATPPEAFGPLPCTPPQAFSAAPGTPQNLLLEGARASVAPAFGSAPGTPQGALLEDARTSALGQAGVPDAVPVPRTPEGPSAS